MRQSSCALTTEVVEQPQRRLHTPRKELVGQVAVRQSPCELQSADHQSEHGERVRSGGLDACRVEACCDVVDDPHYLGGEDISGVARSPTYLVEQGGRRAAVRELVSMF